MHPAILTGHRRLKLTPKLVSARSAGLRVLILSPDMHAYPASKRAQLAQRALSLRNALIHAPASRRRLARPGGHSPRRASSSACAKTLASRATWSARSASAHLRCVWMRV